MKRTISLVLVLITILLCTACQVDKYNRESFYGLVRWSEQFNDLVVYIPGVGDTVIPEYDECTAAFDESEGTDGYQLKSGDLIRINFKYEKSWDNNSVAIMESYPARFDRSAVLIEALCENVTYGKTDSGYEMSIPSSYSEDSFNVGDAIYFIYSGGENGRAYKKLLASGIVTDTSSDRLTISLNEPDSEKEFLEKLAFLSVEKTWME